MSLKKLIVLSGPTAVGKSDVAIRLAEDYNIPIISADSRQVFRQVNIGTSKPSSFQLSKVKHYFIDHIEISENYSTGQYVKEANGLISDLFKVYDKVLICGGTGLYIKSILQGLDNFPDIDNDIRNQVRQNYDRFGIDYLSNELKKLDVIYFDQVDQMNPRRLMRALEVCLSSGQTYSEFLEKSNIKKDYLVREIFLNLDREVLYNMINHRVDKMMKEGLLSEVLELIEYRNTQALNTVGYTELIQYLDNKCTLDEAVEKIKQHTRNYAKRQITWFKKFNLGICLEPNQYEQIKNYIES
ncbi:MAG: tRNA (adenosine(37)-N6)-dimethylallyltransferase MiaA [Saprospiraceae bacterium]